MSDSNVCRLCCFETPFTVPLLHTAAAQMLETLTSIKLYPTDEVTRMCLKCSLNIKLVYNIQQNILRANEKLKRGCISSTSIKKEINPFEPEVESKSINGPNFVACIICNSIIAENCLISHTKTHFNDQFCDLCNQNFTDMKSYRTHLLAHSQYSPSHCKKCDLTFHYKSLYDVHMESTHKNTAKTKRKSPTKELDELQKKGIGPELAQKILIMSYEPKPEPFCKPSVHTCEVCDRQFTDRKKFRHHKSGHTRKECPLCKKLVTSYNFCNHMKNHTSGPQVCEQCGKTFSNSGNLRSHIFCHHREKNYHCEKCNITFKSRNTLYKHKERLHNGTGHVCETCGRKFTFGASLNKHIKITHLKLRPYVCEFCKKGFSGLNAMKTHRRQHTNETPYKCEICGDGFRQNVSLKAHRKSRHNIVEAVTCKCEVCGKGFSSAHAVKSHMRCH